MAKILDWVSANANGSATGPAAGNSITFSYQVKDGDLAKTGVYTPEAPDYGDSLDDIWDGAVVAIKAAEGIS